MTWYANAVMLKHRLGWWSAESPKRISRAEVRARAADLPRQCIRQSNSGINRTEDGQEPLEFHEVTSKLENTQ